MDVDSALLRAFVTVAEELHFHRAAGRLFLSQQALSKRIVRLETLLGVRLLERGSRGVTLTSAGERFLPEARQAVDVLDAALAAVNTGPQTLTVDVLDEHLAMLPSVRQINQREPNLSVTVVMRADAQPALSMLRNGTADIALGRPGALDPAGPRWPADIRGQEVLAEPIRLLVPVGHHLDRPEGVRLEQLVGQPLWFPTTGAPAEWTQLLTEFVDVFDLSLDQTGSTFGYRYWLERIADGSAPISFIGAAMNIPAELPASVVPLFDPTPVFLWWAMWRRRIRPDLAGQFLSALENELKNDALPVDHRWVPERDRPFERSTRHSHSTPTLTSEGPKLPAESHVGASSRRRQVGHLLR